MAAALAVPGTALAADPADTVYNPNGGVLDVVQSGTPTPAPTAPPAATTAPTADVEDETEATPAAPAATPTAAAPTATPETQTTEASTGNLPFTGFEAGFVALAGLALLAGGLAMRRVSRNGL